ncbi:MAG: alpha-hydroxy-acid oxidizing protein, partial [Alcanivoracaceae bacterium]|nr:alpha-hydroxy-acid oxidizing protein [Alcanivoracaceae bacterium]
LPKFIFDFISGGAGNERALKKNISDLDAISLRPFIPDSAGVFNPNKSIFGQPYSLPFGIAPIGLASAVYPKAELVLADCALRHNIPFILSAAANVSIDEVVKTTGYPPWFQLYIPKETQIMDRLIQSAKNNNCPVLVVTVDTAVPGIRLRDLKNQLTIPFKPSFTNLSDMLCNPHWLLKQLLAKKNRVSKF